MDMWIVWSNKVALVYDDRMQVDPMFRNDVNESRLLTEMHGTVISDTE